MISTKCENVRLERKIIRVIYDPFFPIHYEVSQRKIEVSFILNEHYDIDDRYKHALFLFLSDNLNPFHNIFLFVKLCFVTHPIDFRNFVSNFLFVGAVRFFSVFLVYCFPQYVIMFISKTKINI